LAGRHFTAKEKLVGDTGHDPVDHVGITRPRADESFKDTVKAPEVLMTGTGVAAFAICLVSFVFGQAGIGVAAIIVMLLAVGVRLGWFAMQGRRIRQPQRDYSYPG
jgi:hypothetical protein